MPATTESPSWAVCHMTASTSDFKAAPSSRSHACDWVYFQHLKLLYTELDFGSFKSILCLLNQQQLCCVSNWNLPQHFPPENLLAGDTEDWSCKAVFYHWKPDYIQCFSNETYHGNQSFNWLSCWLLRVTYTLAGMLINCSCTKTPTKWKFCARHIKTKLQTATPLNKNL